MMPKAYLQAESWLLSTGYGAVVFRKGLSCIPSSSAIAWIPLQHVVAPRSSLNTGPLFSRQDSKPPPFFPGTQKSCLVVHTVAALNIEPRLCCTS
jgi:hypothetical protein